MRIVSPALQADALVAAIEDLPERERFVMGMYYEHDMNLKEIGAALGVTESRVSQLHSQAVARLLANRLTPDSRSRAGFTVEPPRSAPPVLQSGSDDDEVNRVVVAALTGSRRVVPGIHRDAMLRRLLREALASRFLERRHHASLMLMTSPYRDPVATATARAAELSTSRVTRRAVGLLLTYLAGPGQASTRAPSGASKLA